MYDRVLNNCMFDQYNNHCNAQQNYPCEAFIKDGTMTVSYKHWKNGKQYVYRGIKTEAGYWDLKTKSDPDAWATLHEDLPGSFTGRWHDGNEFGAWVLKYE